MRFSANSLQRRRPQQLLSVSSGSWESLEDIGQPNCLHQFSNSNKVFFLSVLLVEIYTVCIFIWIIYLSVYKYIRFFPMNQWPSQAVEWSVIVDSIESLGWVLSHTCLIWLVGFLPRWWKRVLPKLHWITLQFYLPVSLSLFLSGHLMCRGGSDPTTAIISVGLIKCANWWQWGGKSGLKREETSVSPEVSSSVCGPFEMLNSSGHPPSDKNIW